MLENSNVKWGGGRRVIKCLRIKKTWVNLVEIIVV
jgi:hypothetical protein